MDQGITSEIGDGTRRDPPVRRSVISKMPDQCRWDGADWREEIRREWDMKGLHIDIDTLTTEVTGDKNAGLRNCMEDYATA